MELISFTPLHIAAIAGRTAWQSFHKGGNYENYNVELHENDKEFLKRLFNKYKHLSVAEHIWYSFKLMPYEKSILDLVLKENNGYILYKINSENGYSFIQTNLRYLIEHRYSPVSKYFIGKIPHSHLFLFDITKDEIDNIEFEIKKGEYIDILYIHRGKPFDFYTIRFKNISRALLQELVRHDDFSAMTIKSTRYTLKELKNEEPFIPSGEDLDLLLNKNGKSSRTEFFKRASKYLVMTGNDLIDYNSTVALENLREALVKGISNDIAKYCMPESYKTEGIFTLPERNINNMIKLRTSKDALWEFQRVANELNEMIRSYN